MTFYRIFLGKADMQMIDKDGSGYSKKTINTGIKFLGNALSLAQKCQTKMGVADSDKNTSTIFHSKKIAYTQLCTQMLDLVGIGLQ